jgi:hypothetical protein
MKTAGIIFLIAGLLMTLYSGFSYVTNEKVSPSREYELTQDNRGTVNWQPYVGIGVMIMGGALIMLGRKKPPIN